MSKLNMKLTTRDEENVNMLKERYGFVQTSELVRFLLINATEQIRREGYEHSKVAENDSIFQ